MCKLCDDAERVKTLQDAPNTPGVHATGYNTTDKPRLDSEEVSFGPRVTIPKDNTDQANRSQMVDTSAQDAEDYAADKAIAASRVERDVLQAEVRRLRAQSEEVMRLNSALQRENDTLAKRYNQDQAVMAQLAAEDKAIRVNLNAKYKEVEELTRALDLMAGKLRTAEDFAIQITQRLPGVK